MRAARYDREVFGCLLLNARHFPMAEEDWVFGSIDRTIVCPRGRPAENPPAYASGLLLRRNHPSGVAEPPPSDIQPTIPLHDLLKEIDIRLVDHIVVSQTATVRIGILDLPRFRGQFTFGAKAP